MFALAPGERALEIHYIKGNATSLETAVYPTHFYVNIDVNIMIYHGDVGHDIAS